MAVFAFLEDWDAIGPSYQNIGLIENDNYFQAVKIDPTYSHLDTFQDEDDYGLEKYLEALTAKKFKFYYADRGACTEVFQYCTREEINDGMRRVAELSDEQLRSIIYNKLIPLASLPKEERDEIYGVLIKRRDAFRAALKNLLHKSLFWTTNKKIGAGLLVGGIGAFLGSEDKVIFEPGLYNSLAMAGIGMCLVLFYFVIKSNLEKCCETNTSQGSFQRLG